MTSISDSMTRNHRECDERFAAAEGAAGDGDWARAASEFASFRTAMERHFGVEEEVLFPAFERQTGTTAGPTEVMRMEHAEMRDLFERLAAAAVARDADDFLGLAETFNLLMQQHNMKEEQVLYALMDEKLGGEADSLLAALAH
ncbi:MAG TPA: hemerythrin domain-containing protein [Burkholderiales bacterium]|nr:hemerythrin domain-containing protein [Burkholderiales bacterium]